MGTIMADLAMDTYPGGPLSTTTSKIAITTTTTMAVAIIMTAMEGESPASPTQQAFSA